VEVCRTFPFDELRSDGRLQQLHDRLVPVPAAHDNDVRPSESFESMSTDLDGLLLALATAGAYLDQVATTFSDYLRLHRESWLKLQQTSPELS
jgi:hypothetical protein